jgi:hypothetical protein
MSTIHLSVFPLCLASGGAPPLNDPDEFGDVQHADLWSRAADNAPILPHSPGEVSVTVMFWLFK